MKLFRGLLLIFIISAVISASYEFASANVGLDVIFKNAQALFSGQQKVSTENNTAEVKSIKDPKSILVLVNRKNSLPKEYVPEDLVVPNVKFASGVSQEETKMRKEAAKSLEEMVKKAKEDNMNFYCVSGYRSYNNQKQTYESKVKTEGKEYADKYVAYPGYSEHQTGLAMDVSNMIGSSSQDIKDFGQTREGRWLKDNAYKFGFIIRYPEGRENITEYSYEPWHIRYVGKKAAGEIKTKGIVMEEYI